MPTLKEYAALSNDVYYTQEQSLPPGWKRVYQSHIGTDGFFGALYVKKEGGNLPTEMCVAVRGTDLNHGTLKIIQDLLQDGQLFLHLVPDQFIAANIFLANALNYANNQYKSESRIPVTFTGHSLGALVANLMMLTLKPEEQQMNNCACVTFENPGFAPILNRKLNQYRSRGVSQEMLDTIKTNMWNRCTTYLADINFINSCNKQCGKTHRLVDKDYQYDNNMSAYPPRIPIAAIPEGNLHYIYSYTMTEHDMSKILGYINADKRIEEVEQPFGIHKSYKSYLDGESRKRYWDGYFLTIWNTNDQARKDYKNDAALFLQDCYMQLRDARGAPKSTIKFFEQHKDKLFVDLNCNRNNIRRIQR